MRLHVGCDLGYEFVQPTPLIAMLNVHASRVSDLEQPDLLITDPPVPVEGYRDTFGNWCNRMVAPAGAFKLSIRGIIRDDGQWDEVSPDAQQAEVQLLPHDALLFLLGSRYCETDVMSGVAWELFGQTQPGWTRVKAIVDYVHNHLTFSYPQSRPTRTAAEAYREQIGVCRDFAHLAITFCRSLNIPARYCTGYISDVGLPPPHAPQDFAAWMEVYLDGRWHVFDPRNNDPRIGRILVAYGRDAADVPMTMTFGPNILTSFEVITEELAPLPA